MTDDKPRNLITLRAATERGGFSKTTALTLIRNGTLIAYKMGGKTMVDADSLAAYHGSLPRIMPDKGGRDAG